MNSIFKNPAGASQDDALSAKLSKQWYVLYTKPRQEPVAQEHLARQGFEVYLPKVELTKRRKGILSSIIEPFFPRYLFISFDRERDDWAPIRSTRGVCGLVRFGGVPKPVSASLIEMLKSNENTEKLQCINANAWKSGDRVEIEQGPFAGYSCIYQAEKSAARVSVLLNIVGKQTRATLLKENLQIPQYA